VCKLHGLLDVPYHAAFGNLKPYTFHRLAEEVPILGLTYRGDRGAQKLDTVLFKNTLLVQLHREIQGSLTTKGRQDGIGVLATDDLGNRLHSKRFHVGSVGKLRIRHDGSWIGVDQ
jgi:hypothetical protein